jgi:hypothetical protein
MAKFAKAQSSGTGTLATGLAQIVVPREMTRPQTGYDKFGQAYLGKGRLQGGVRVHLNNVLLRSIRYLLSR